MLKKQENPSHQSLQISKLYFLPHNQRDEQGEHTSDGAPTLYAAIQETQGIL